MAAALHFSSAAAVWRVLRISQAALSTLPSASRPAAVAPFLRTIAAISGANNAFSWNFRRLLSSKKTRILPSSKWKPRAMADPEIKTTLMDLMAASWNELPHSLVEQAKKAVSKDTDDVAGQEALKNAFRAAEACKEFGGVLVTLRVALDDLCGLTGVIVGPLPGIVDDAVSSAYYRYMTYLKSFRPDEYYLRDKVETELRKEMIHLKMRCSGIRPRMCMLFLDRDRISEYGRAQLRAARAKAAAARAKAAEKSRGRTSTG